MFNILLDSLPTEWNGYEIDSDFQIGIMISQCMRDESLNKLEKICTAASLLFGENTENYPQSHEEISEALQWFLNGWNQDNVSTGKKSTGKKQEIESMDFDTDQWRIYAAFKEQYGIDLNTIKHLHFWMFMGLLTNLEECTFTRVISIREKKIDSKMSKEEKSFLQKAKELFKIRKTEDFEESEEEKEERQNAIDKFNRLRKKGK